MLKIFRVDIFSEKFLKKFVFICQKSVLFPKQHAFL